MYILYIYTYVCAQHVYMIVQCSNPISGPLQSHQSPPSWFRRWADEIAAKRRANAVKKVQLW